MDKLAAMRTFVAIADHGSLTAAADALGKAQPTVVRSLAALEQALGVRLMRRTTRRLALTEAGHGYLARCRRKLADVDEAEQIISAADHQPKGHLRISAPVAFGQMHAMPLLCDFLQRYADIDVELHLLDRVVNLLEEGVDLALRIGHLRDSTLVATPVGEMRRVVVASPKLLSTLNAPHAQLVPGDLSRYPCVGFRGLGDVHHWRFSEQGKELSIAVQGPLVTNQALAAVAACDAGLGFGVFLAYQVAPWIKQGKLRVVLRDYEPPPLPVNLVYTETRLMTQRLRVLLDYMRTNLREELSHLMPA